MVKNFAVPSCKRKWNSDQSIFSRFPANAKRRATWEKAIFLKSGEVELENKWVCSAHFISGEDIQKLNSDCNFRWTREPFSTVC